MKKSWIIVVVVICVVFILFQSAVPESKSFYESYWFTENVINPLLHNFGITADKDVVRKLAHVIEFCILSIVIMLCLKKSIRACYAGFILAFIDESLQVVTGRGALITDVWIDLIGVIVGVGIGCVLIKVRKS